MYFKYDGYEEQIMLITYQTMSHFAEFADILAGKLDWRNAPFFSQYFKADEHSVFPKFILYSSHAEEVAPLLHALENPLLVDPSPASAVFVEYFESAQGDLRVRVLFNDNTWEFEDRKPLFFNRVVQAEDGSMTVDEFKRFISAKIEGWDSEYPQGDVPEKCDQPFEFVDPSRTDFFAPPESFREALYNYYGVKPVLPSASELMSNPQFIMKLNHKYVYGRALSFVVPEEYPMVLAAVVLLCIECFLVGVLVADPARSKYFTRDLLAQFGHDEKATKRGFPDNGEGRHAEKLDYKDWIELNTSLRVHADFVNILPLLVIVLTVSGLYLPKAAMWVGFANVVVRLVSALTFMRWRYECRSLSEVAGTIPVVLLGVAVFID